MDQNQSQVVIYEQAPCRPEGQITSEGQGETRDAACYCPLMPEGCCVSGPSAIIVPKRLKPEYAHLARKESSII